ALMWFFRADWARVVRGFLRSLRRSLRDRRLAVADTDERLAWMIVFATIPVGLTGVALEHTFRTLFAKPALAGFFLFVTGLVLAGAETLCRRAARRRQSSPVGDIEPAPVMAAAAAARVATVAPAATGRPHSHRKTPAGRARADMDSARQSDRRIASLPYVDA